MPSRLRARVADETRGRTRTHDAAGLGVEGQLPDWRERVDERGRHTSHTVRHVAGMRVGPGSGKSSITNESAGTLSGVYKHVYTIALCASYRK